MTRGPSPAAGNVRNTPADARAPTAVASSPTDAPNRLAYARCTWSGTARTPSSP